MRTDQLKKEYGVEFIWRVFPLHPEVPVEGVELTELFAGSGYDVSSMQKRLAEVAAREGLPLGTRTRVSNGRAAQELGKYAEELGQFEPYAKAVYHAYFVLGRNIARKEELLEIAAGLGLPGEGARQALEERRYSAAVDSDWELSRTLGITGVPAFVYQGKLLVGFRPYRDFIRFIGRGTA